MIEIIIPLIITLALSSAGVIVWNTFRGPANNHLKGALRIILVSLIAILTVITLVWRLSKSRSIQLFGGMVTHITTSEPVVALTFDDGPLPGYTEEILEILETKNIKATFFVTGQELAQNLVEGTELVAAGHEVGNHTYSHRQMVGVGYKTVQEEIEQTDESIRAAEYKGEIQFRPPFGKRFIVLPYYLRIHRRRTIYWNVEPESYKEIAGSAELIESHVLEEVKPGSIILLHVMGESHRTTIQAVPGIIDGLLEQGYKFVTVSELLEYDNK